jgi:hypothetical protein
MDFNKSLLILICNRLPFFRGNTLFIITHILTLGGGNFLEAKYLLSLLYKLHTDI